MKCAKKVQALQVPESRSHFARKKRSAPFENPGLGPRFLPTSPSRPNGVGKKEEVEDDALAGRLRTRLTKKNGNDIAKADAKYLVNALLRAPAIGERTVRLVLSMLEHAHLEDVSLWEKMFQAVAKKCARLDEIMPPERVVTVIHELADKLDKFEKLDEEAVEKLLALGTLRGIPNIRTRRALESIRRLHPMTAGASALMKARLSEIPLAPPKPWTFFFYMASENNLESYAVDDINDMERTFAKITPFANVVVLADGGVVNDEDKTLGPQPANNWSSKSRLILIEEGDGRGQVMSRTIPVPNDTPLGGLMEKGKGELNLGNKDTLRRSIEFVQQSVPSDHLFFSIWSHGLAWKGVAEDDGDMLRPHEMVEALNGLKKAPEVMGFDACLMANNGFAQLLSKMGVSYLIGSEELLDAEGWGYHRVFSGFEAAEKKAGKLTPQNLAHTLVDSANATTISAVRLESSPKIWSHLEDLGKALMAAGGRKNEQIQEMVEQLPRYGSYGVDASEEDQALGDEEVVDIVHLCEQFEARFPNSDIARAAKKLRQVSDDATHHKNMPSVSYPGIENYSHGLTTYLPRKAEDFARHYLGRGALWKDEAPTWIKLLKQK